jgi:hypothetical protein
MWTLLACADPCGRGTVERGGVCVAREPQIVVVTERTDLVCGPGTVEQDGVCVVEDPEPTCGAGTVLRGDLCVPLAPVEVVLPFPAGTTVGVSQGMHGNFSHTGASEYAVDFPVPEGTLVVAVRPGRVVEVKEDGDYGCADASCSGYGNFVTVDHGDGTFDQYWHFQYGGALVEAGDLVGRGMPIGLSGNTGWTTAPHLHLQARDPLGQSLPLVFTDQPEGTVFAGGTFTSSTVEEPAPAEVPWSTCPVDLLDWLGVRLDEGLPCSFVEPDTDYPVGGQLLVSGARAATGQYSVQTDLWSYGCAEPWSGRFDAVLRWPSTDYQLRTYYLLASAKPEDCGPYQSWDRSIYLTLAR